MPPEIITAIVGLFGAISGAAATYFLGRKQVAAQTDIAQKAAAAELLIAQQRLGAENRLADASHKAIERLLRQKEWELRSFDALKKHLPGFEDNELRKLLVAAGAISFAEDRTGRELWGLMDRNAVKLAPRRGETVSLLSALPAASVGDPYPTTYGAPVAVASSWSLLPPGGFPGLGSSGPVAAPPTALYPKREKS